MNAPQTKQESLGWSFPTINSPVVDGVDFTPSKDPSGSDDPARFQIYSSQ